VCDSHSLPKVASRPGTLAPLHCSATGKIFVSHIFREAIDEIEDVVGLERHTENTLTTIASLTEEASSIILKGYASDEEEFCLGVRCLAAPIFNKHGTAIASIGVTAPTSALTREKISATAVTVKQAATKVYLANRASAD